MVAFRVNETRSGCAKPMSRAIPERAEATERAAARSSSAAPREQLPAPAMATTTASATAGGFCTVVAALLR